MRAMLSLLFLLIQSTTPLSLEDALARALRAYPDTKIAALGEAEATARRKSATGALLPRLRVEGGVQVWDSPLRVNFVDNPPDLSTVPEPFQPLLAGLSEPTQVRDQLTANLQVTLAQPLTGLYPLIKARQLESLGVEAAQAASERARNELAFKVIDAYGTALLAQAGQRVAQKGIALSEQLLERAQALAQVGIVAQGDVLRAKVSLANAREAEINARTGATLAMAALRMYVGGSEDEEFSLQDPPGDAEPVALDAALARAREHRPELREIHKRIAQADAAVHLARSQMIPSVVALANYTYTAGQRFAITNQLFFGAALTWDVWEWGNKWYLIDAAQARAEAAKLELEKTEQLLMLDLRQAHTRHLVAKESLAATRVAQEAAAEFLKNEETRFGAGQITASDLAMAQTNFLQAELNEATSRSRAFTARAALDKAMGLQPK